jgi:uncharacterized alkaline shock family protein YloU
MLNPRNIDIIEYMTISKTTKLGTIAITPDAISAVAGSSSLECYGVVGLAPKNFDGDKKLTPLKASAFKEAIVVKKSGKTYSVDLYIILAYGVKITEIVSEVQKKVKYDLEKKFDVSFLSVNVFVQALKTV